MRAMGLYKKTLDKPSTQSVKRAKQIEVKERQFRGKRDLLSR
jgi:hypothetical protein